MRTPSRGRIGRATSRWLLLPLLAGCSGVSTRGVDDFDWSKPSTFAWREPPRIAAAPAAGDEAAVEELEREVVRRLRDHGLGQVEKETADLVVTAKLRVVRRTLQNDRNYSLYVAEDYEEGVLEIDVYDRVHRRLVWHGECTDRLRFVGRWFGNSSQPTETGEPRLWHIEGMVQRVLDALPR